MTSQPITGPAITHQPAATKQQQDPGGRLELHNPSVNEALADDGACAQIHLPTGRVCLLAHHHPGSCQFDPPPGDA